jgi:HflK protein
VSAEKAFLLTGDVNLVDLRWAVQYRIKDPMAFAFNLADPETFVRATSLSALRAVVAHSGIDAIYTSDRSVVEEQTQGALQAMLDRTRAGVEIVALKLIYVHPPEEVHDAFRDVASAQEDKLTAVNRAHIFAVETVNQAKGEAAAMVEEALGFKDQEILRAQGDAAAFLLKLDAYRHARELTRFRVQIETLESTLPGMQKFVRPGPQELKSFDMWLLQPLGTAYSR